MYQTKCNLKFSLSFTTSFKPHIILKLYCKTFGRACVLTQTCCNCFSQCKIHCFRNANENLLITNNMVVGLKRKRFMLFLDRNWCLSVIFLAPNFNFFDICWGKHFHQTNLKQCFIAWRSDWEKFQICSLKVFKLLHGINLNFSFKLFTKTLLHIYGCILPFWDRSWITKQS